MPASRETSPENDVLSMFTEIVPVRDNKQAATTSITFGHLLPPTTPLVLHEDLQQGCGGQLWPAGMVLSKYILQNHSTCLRGKKIAEIGAGGGLVGLAVALGCEMDAGQKIYITDQVPMLALMEKNILLNNLQDKVQAMVYDWGTPPPAELVAAAQWPDVVLAADCVYFEPAFPLLLHTLTDLIGPQTTCFFCFKKRRKADMRFIRDMIKKFAVTQVEYDDKEQDQRHGIFLYRVTRAPTTGR
ncbi:hypothetical protein PV10_07955 [Exophiala mesophila]|uniref:Protein-lysine N-methyltransferase EFM6 n=1 Tax=Exophiala mesophila TaxID=212818 RepID=A0A0D1Z088_EXOME|nr:uncharacterized protein PV10_07955 [Exophiala mesophila]KIV88257.1 hypothetical protein PV10_07955 [Exophiala mesophila]